MNNQDFLHRFVFDNEPVRGEYIRLETSLQTILDQHKYPPLLRHLLSEALCVAGLLSAIIKFKGKLTVQFRGPGKLKLLLAQCNQDLQIRGLVKVDGGDLTHEELLESFQHGVLAIMLDGGSEQTRYQGIVPWVGNSLAASVEGYFQMSEQLPTKLWLSVSDTHAVGFLLQVMPTPEKETTAITQAVTEPSFSRLSKLTQSVLDNDILLNLPYENLLKFLYIKDVVRIFDAHPVTFSCTCSRKKSAEAIRLIGKDEAEEELKDKNSIVVTCDFCSKEYVFDRVDVAEIFNHGGSLPPDTHIH